MDIPRVPPNRKARRVWYGAAAAGLVVLATLGFKGLKPDAPQVDLATIWVDSFFTTKEHGSGIGLVLSRQIAEAPGGSLTLEQRRDRNGARARLRLRWE